MSKKVRTAKLFVMARDGALPDGFDGWEARDGRVKAAATGTKAPAWRLAATCPEPRPASRQKKRPRSPAGQ